MKPSNKWTFNRVLIPKSLCHRFNLHRWLWMNRNRSTISARCVRCGMNGIEYLKRTK